MSTDLVPKSSKNYCCEKCDYYTFRKSQYDRHLSTDKHLNQGKSTIINQKVPKSSAAFDCICGKKYKDNSGLWRHKKSCSKKEEKPKEEEKQEINEEKDLIMLLIKENSELKNMMMEVIKNNTTNNTNINNSNKLCYNFSCKICDYNTNKKSSFNNHLLSAKHIKTINNKNMPKLCSTHKCENCEKEYNDRAGLWRHKKKCIQKEKIESENNISTKLLLNIIQQNQEFKNLLIEQNKQNNELQKNVIEVSKIAKTITINKNQC